MSRRLRLLLVPVSALVLLASACGDDGDEVVLDDTAITEAVDDGFGTGPDEQSADDRGPDDAAAGAGEDEQPPETTATVPDAEAEPPPEGAGGEDEGMGDSLVLVAELSGEAEVPGPGDPAGTGRTEIETDVDGDLCFDMVATGLGSEVTDAHIHEGAAAVSGGVVIPIGPPTATEGDTDTWTDVCVDVDDAIVERITADPSAFYANVHTAQFGAGAIRGQLQQASIFDLELS
jgi:hypothetical protein